MRSPMDHLLLRNGSCCRARDSPSRLLQAQKQAQKALQLAVEVGLVAPQALEIGSGYRHPERLIADQGTLAELPPTILVPGQHLDLEKPPQAQSLGTPGLLFPCR